MTKTMIALAASLVLTAPGLARAADTVETGQAVSWELDRPGSLTWEIRLDAGHDYALAVGGGGLGGKATVREAGGRSLAAFPFTGDEEFVTGAEFRALRSGYFFVTISTTQPVPEGQQGPAFWAVSPDCLASPASRCVLPVGGQRPQRPWNFSRDSDWYGTTLRAGRPYHAALVAPDQGAGIQVRDARGRVVVPATAATEDDFGNIELDFTVPAGGAYFLEAARGNDGGGPPYDLSLATR